MIADPELGDALRRVRAATGTHEPDATLVRRLAVEGADAELKAGRDRRAAAEALFAAMERGGFDLDLAAIDRLNERAGSIARPVDAKPNAQTETTCSASCAAAIWA